MGRYCIIVNNSILLFTIKQKIIIFLHTNFAKRIYYIIPFVDQSSISKDKLVKHSQVPSIVCSIVKESIGHPLSVSISYDLGLYYTS